MVDCQNVVDPASYWSGDSSIWPRLESGLIITERLIWALQDSWKQHHWLMPWVVDVVVSSEWEEPVEAILLSRRGDWLAGVSWRWVILDTTTMHHTTITGRPTTTTEHWALSTAATDRPTFASRCKLQVEKSPKHFQTASYFRITPSIATIIHTSIP